MQDARYGMRDADRDPEDSRSGAPNTRQPTPNAPSLWALLAAAALVLAGTGWMDIRNARCGAQHAGCRTVTGYQPPHPQDPGLDTRHPNVPSASLLQAVIVNRLARRPAPVGCAPSPFYDLVERYAGLHGLDGRLVAAVMEAESGFDPGALSEKGAVGLMQILPSTASDLGVTDPWDPVQNVAAGVRYLRTLLERYGGDVQKALAAYNTGLDRVDRSESEAWPAETRQFVQRVLRAYDRLHKACP